MKNLLVSNTGPIVALCIVDQLNLLQKMFREIYISQKVHDEILSGGSNRSGVDVYQKVDFIQVSQIEVNSIDPLLIGTLDDGEAEVIQLALMIKPDCVLIDERKARKGANDIYQLPVIGTAGLLIEAKRQGLIQNVSETLIEMKRNGYWIHEAIIDRALRLAGEIKPVNHNGNT